MPRVKSVGGRRGPARVDYLKGIPGFPRMPRPPHKVGEVDFVKTQQQEEAAARSKEQRQIAWGATHPGGTGYDFLIHDFLLNEKKLAETDFVWQGTYNGIPLDYHFPSKAMAWDVTSRKGTHRTRVLDPTLSHALARNGGLHVINLFTEDLDSDPAGTLGAAWVGLQR